ncbi:MAG TPA: TonB-dependent receptor [Candidatus Didemnitutus sp.]|nr:TonB-dependent receptor [Candidatus Didemnitutus sp.]
MNCHYPRIFAVASLAIALAISLPAQTAGTGVVTGRIYNPATHEYVAHAEVSVQGTNLSAFTAEDGTYVLRNVPAGAAIVTVTYTGAKTESATVTATANGSVTQDFNLTSGTTAPTDEKVLKLDTFTISTERQGNAKAIMQQKESMNISNVVASETFGNIAEGNIGEFIKYLPAIQMDTVEADARSPRIRGLPAQYTSVTMNGMGLASADGFIQNNGTDTSGGAGTADRSFGFEQVSLSSIDAVEVNYTTNASQDADSPAGNINLIPKHAYQISGQRIVFDASAMMNSEEMYLHKSIGPDDRENYKVLPNLLVGYGNSFFHNRLGIIVSFNESNSFNEQRQFAPGYNTTPTATDTRPLVITKLQFKDGPKVTERTTGSYTLDFKATDQLSFSLIGTINHYNAFVGNRTFAVTTASRANVTGDGLTSWTNVPISAVTSTMAYLNKRTNGYNVMPSFAYKAGNVELSGIASISKSVNNYAGGQSASWPGNTIGGTTLATTGMTVTAAQTGSDPYAWNIHENSGLDWGNLANYKAAATAYPTFGVDGRYVDNLKLQARLDAKYTTNWKMPTWFQVGAKTSETTYVYQNPTAWQTWNYVGPGGGLGGTWVNYPSGFDFDPGHGTTITSTTGAPVAVQDHDTLGALFKSHPEYFVLQATPANFDTSFIINPRYIREEIDALYGMFDVKPVKKLELQAGLRYERTREETKNFVQLPSSQVQAAGYPISTATGLATTIPGLQYQYLSQARATTSSFYNGLFPSASLKYSFTPKLIGLLGYSYTVTRPSYNDLAGVSTEDDTTSTIGLPNPLLKPEYANNYSARLTYYFEPVGTFGMGLFQNDFRNFITSQTLTGDAGALALASALGYTGPQYADYAITTKINLPGSTVFRGATVEYSQALSMLPKPFDGLNVFANYTRLYAEVKVPNPAVNLHNPGPYNFGWVPGIAPNVVNYGFSWKIGRLTIGPNFRWTDRMSISSTYDSWRTQNTKIDLNASLRLTDHLSLYFYARNLFNVPDHDYTYFYNSKVNSTPMLLSSQGQGIEYYGAYFYAGIKGEW